MAQKKENNTEKEAQETLKKEKAYKVTCGTFKARKKALQDAAEAKGKGINVSLAISNAGYVLHCADGLTKAGAEALKRAIEAKKLQAEITEQ